MRAEATSATPPSIGWRRNSTGSRWATGPAGDGRGSGDRAGRVHGARATAAAEYHAAYFLEKSLSIDNMIVFVMVFSELHIPAEHQRRVHAPTKAGA